MLNRFTLELLAFRELLAIADLRVLEEQNSGVVTDSALVERLYCSRMINWWSLEAAQDTEGNSGDL